MIDTKDRKSLKVFIELSFERCQYDAQEAQDRLERQFNSYGYDSKALSEFVVSLLRNLKASTWEIDKIEVLEK